MVKYDYSGPTQRISLSTGKKRSGGKLVSVFEDFALINGKECELPEDNGAVQTMLAAKLLTPAGSSAKPAKPKSTGDKSDG